MFKKKTIVKFLIFICIYIVLCLITYYQNLSAVDLPDKDIYTIFYRLITDGMLFNFLPIFGFLFLIIFSISDVNTLLKSKYLYYYDTRRKYIVFIKKIILSSYKYILSIPIIVVFIYFLALLIREPSLYDPLSKTITFPDVDYKYKFLLAYYTLHLMFRWASYINIGLIVQSKNRKFIFNVIECILIYFILDIFVETKFPSDYTLLIFDPYTVTRYSIFRYLLVSIIYFIISFILVIFAYRNKEKLLNRVGDEN